jgi:tetratricopeptide (TPR) repeat protein
VKQVDDTCLALRQARQRGRGALTIVRAQTKESLEEALAAFLRTPGWKWHEIDAGDCANGRELLMRAKQLTVDEDDVWLAWGLPSSGGDNGNPDFYNQMADASGVVEVLGGPRIVIFVGVPQMQAMVRLARPLWDRKRSFVAWPEAEKEARPRVARADPGGAPRPNSSQPSATAESPEQVLGILGEQLKSSKSHSERARLLQKMALLLAGMNQLERSRVACTKAAKVYKDLAAPRGLAQCYELLGSLAERRGNVDVARDWVKFALEAWEQIEEAGRRSECHAKLGHLSYVMGDREDAAQHFQLAIELDEEQGDKRKVAAGLRRLGLMAEEEQKFGIAEKLFEDSLVLCQETGDEVGSSRSLHAKGRLYERMQDYARAFEMHRESLEIKERLNDRLGMATSYHHLGNTYLFSRDFEQAKACYQQALQIEDEVGDNQGRAATLQQLGEVSMAEHRWGDALWYFTASHTLFRQLGSPVAHTVSLHISRATEMLDDETVEQIRADVKTKMSEYTTE